jgi:hypothetical protein
MNQNIRLFVLICFSILANFSVGQTGSELVKFEELVFSNEQEKNSFLSFNESKTNDLEFNLLYSSYDHAKTGQRTVALQKIENSVNYLKKEVDGKSEVKKVKITYDYIHKQFLKVYKLKNSFMDLFELGEYNCVSSTALYAIVFSKLNIPYQIRETPEHVYLVAYPNTSKVLIETTSPTKGYFQFNNSFVTSFVQNLYESKIITKEEFESTPPNELFNKHYFTSESVTLLELSGLQYSNYAIFALDDNNLSQANEQCKKAYYLFKGEKHKYLLKSIVANMLDKNGYGSFDNVVNLSILCRYNNMKPKEINNDVIVNEFTKVLHAQLIYKSDYSLIDKSYKLITSELKDSALKSEIGFNYYFELARLGYLNSKGKEYQIENLANAYKFNPLNANLRSLIIAHYSQFIEKYDDCKGATEFSEMFVERFDFLKTHELYLTVKGACYLENAYKSYYFDDIKAGDQYLVKFDELNSANPNVIPSESFVEKAYAQAAVAYYKKGNYAKSKQLLKAGLKYAPNNFGLQQRLKQIP